MNKFSRAEGHITTFYICPNCGEPNTLRMNKERLHMHPMGQCTDCREHVCFYDLLNEYGPKNHAKLYFHCVEFICDECGRVNFIRNAIEREATFVRTSNDPGEIWKPEEDRDKEILYVSGSSVPTKADCEWCGEPHQVMY